MPLDLPTITLVTIALALVFDFINGFHDASNSIATIVATRVLKYWQAVIWAAFFNFVAFFFISAGVAKTVGAGLMNLDFVTPMAIAAALVGGIIWNLLTWWKGIPASSSHTLMGAFAGAVTAQVLLHHNAVLADVYVLDGWVKVLAFIFIAPLVGYLAAFVVMSVAYTIEKRWQNEAKRNRFFTGCQLASSALLSFMHGGNDAQKTAGIIASALAVGGVTAADGSGLHIPDWVLFAAYLMIALGTLAGGWRIVRTLGFQLTQLKPKHGFSAETGAAISIGLATWLHLPISTTLATTGAVVGVGSARGPSSKHNPDDSTVNWALFRKIGAVWIITLPAAFAFGAVAMLIADNIF